MSESWYWTVEFKWMSNRLFDFSQSGRLVLQKNMDLSSVPSQYIIPLWTANCLFSASSSISFTFCNWRYHENLKYTNLKTKSAMRILPSNFKTEMNQNPIVIGSGIVFDAIPALGNFLEQNYWFLAENSFFSCRPYFTFFHKFS